MKGTLLRTFLLAVTVTSSVNCAALLRGRGGSSSSGEPDQGITSETHKSHVGGMVFAAAEINKGEEDPASFKDAVTLGEPLYGRFYLKDSLRTVATQRKQDTKNVNGYQFVLRASVDGTQVGESTYEMEPHWSTYKFTFVRTESDSTPWDQTGWFLNDVAPKIEVGEHELQLAVLAVPPGKEAAEGEPVATGTVKLVVDKGSQAKIAAAQAREKQLGEQLAAARAASAASSSSSASASSSSGGSGKMNLTSTCDNSRIGNAGSVPLRVEYDGGALSTSIGTGHTSTELSVDKLPAKICVVKQHGSYECTGNTVELSSATRQVTIAEDCLTITAE